MLVGEVITEWQAVGLATATIIGGLATAIVMILRLRYGPGSKATIAELESASNRRIAEMKAQAELSTARAVEARAETVLKAAEARQMEASHAAAVSTIRQEYDKKISELKTEAALALSTVKAEAAAATAELKAHVDIIDKKLDASEIGHRQCLEEKARLQGLIEGRMAALEHEHKVLEHEQRDQTAQLKQIKEDSKSKLNPDSKYVQKVLEREESKERSQTKKDEPQ